MIKKRHIILGIVLSLIVTGSGVQISHAAVITIHPPDIADNKIQVTLDTQGQLVNAIELHLSFDPGAFLIQQVSDGNSVVNLWIKPPAFSNENGTIDLEGIIPGGVIISRGVIATIEIIPKQGGMEGRFAASGTVLLNDGKGTPATISFAIAPFSLSDVSIPTSSATTDIIPPNPFLPIVASEQDLFNGQYVLLFSTTDEGSGMDHYEVLETAAAGTGGGNTNWQKASSPYVLKDQTLSSDIYVRAVDRAGNFRMVKIPAVQAHTAAAGHSSLGYGDILTVFGILIAIGIFIGAAWIRKRK